MLWNHRSNTEGVKLTSTFILLLAVIGNMGHAESVDPPGYTTVFESTFGSVSSNPGRFSFNESGTLFTVPGVLDVQVCASLCSTNEECIGIYVSVGNPSGEPWDPAAGVDPTTVCIGLSDLGQTDQPDDCNALACRSLSRSLVDECALGYCQTNGNCTDTTASFLCDCEEGFQLSTGNCIDVNECSISDLSTRCAQSASCINVDGSFECVCRDGFFSNFSLPGDLYLGERCVDFDECSLNFTNTCHENASCANSIGSYQCACLNGWSGDGTACTNTNECQDVALDTCSEPNQHCVDLEGSFHCVCSTGFEIDNDSERLACVNFNECDVHIDECNNDATCVDTVGSFECICNTGYTGDGLSCEDIDECSQSGVCEGANAVCSNLPGTFDCGCTSGWQRENDQCVNVYECDYPQACDENATCDDIIGSFTCTCHVGFSGDGRRCRAIDYCREGLHTCAEPIDCRMDWESHSFSCQCGQGTHWVEDNLSCVDEDECSESPCHPLATCQNTYGSFSCVCNDGYLGDGENDEAGCISSFTLQPTTSSPSSESPTPSTLRPSRSPTVSFPTHTPTRVPSQGPSAEPSKVPSAAPAAPTSECGPNIALDLICFVVADAGECCADEYRGRCNRVCCGIECTSTVSPTVSPTSSQPTANPTAGPSQSPSLAPSTITTQTTTVTTTATTSTISMSTSASTATSTSTSTLTSTITSVTTTSTTSTMTVTTVTSTASIEFAAVLSEEDNVGPLVIGILLVFLLVLALATWAVASKVKRKQGEAAITSVPASEDEHHKAGTVIVNNSAYEQDSVDVYIAEREQRAHEKHLTEAEMAKKDREHAENVRLEKLALQRKLVEQYDQREVEARAAAEARQKSAAEYLRILQEHGDMESKDARDKARARMDKKRREAEAEYKRARDELIEFRRTLNNERAELTQAEMEAEDAEIRRRADIKYSPHR